MRKIKLRMFVAFIATAFLLSSLPAFTQSTGEARIIYSYMVLHGRKPDSKELSKWNLRNFRNLGEAFNAIKADLNTSSNYDDSRAYSKKIMIIKCYRDALAYNPSIDEVKYWLPRTDSYSALFDNHMNYANNAGIYDKVISDAHKNAAYRDPTAVEMNYWREKTKNLRIPAYLIEGFIKSRKQKNGSYKLQSLLDPLGGLFASFLNIFAVPPAVAAEAYSIAPTPEAAGNLGKSMAAMVAAGGGNLIGNDGGTIVPTAGGSLVGNDGASMVAAGAGN